MIESRAINYIIIKGEYLRNEFIIDIFVLYAKK